MSLFREGYDTLQIAKLIGKPEAAVLKLLDSARHFERQKSS